jgi:D-aspartate ligase
LQEQRSELPIAIVLGMTVTGLGVARSLGRKGIPVLALEKHSRNVGQFSRYVVFRICPDPQKDEKQFLDYLLNISKEYPGAVLLPTDDVYVLFLAEWEELLRKYFRFCFPSKDIMLKLLNKKFQYQLAKNCGVPLPKTFFPKNFHDASRIADELNFPSIIKPLYSHEWKLYYGTKKGIITKNRCDFLREYKGINNNIQIEVMVQEVIIGDDTRHSKVCAYFNKDSDPILTFTLRKIRQCPCDFGVGSVVESVWIPDVAEIGLKFMKDIKYVGIGSVEFKRDQKDNKLKMIEMNSRFWAQNSLAEVCGMNFAYTAYLDLVGKRIEKQIRFKESVKWLDFEADLTSFRGYHSQKRLGYWQWFKSFRGKKVWAKFTWDDPMPFIISINFGLRIPCFFLKKIKTLFFPDRGY